MKSLKKAIKFLTRSDREANLNRMYKMKEEREITGFVEDVKNDSFITFGYNENGKKEYGYIENRTRSENIKELKKQSVINDIEENEDTFMDFNYENSLTREDKKERLEAIRKNKGLRYEIPEQQQSIQDKKREQEAIDFIQNKYF